MHFENGKCYKHPSGRQLHVIAEIETTLCGKGLVAEQFGKGYKLIQLNNSQDSFHNWSEIPKSTWEKNFSL